MGYGYKEWFDNTPSWVIVAACVFFYGAILIGIGMAIVNALIN